MRLIIVWLLIAMPFVAEAGDRTPAVVMPRPFVLLPLNLASLSSPPVTNAASSVLFRPPDNATGAAIVRAVAGGSARRMASRMPIIWPNAAIDRSILRVQPKSREKFELLVATPKVEDRNIHRLSPTWQPRNPRAGPTRHPGRSGRTLNKPRDRMPGSRTPGKNDDH